jgi:hypothetical protein
MMQKSIIFFIILIFLAQIGFISCSNNLKYRNPSLLLYPNSDDLHYGVYGKIEQLSYTIQISYPAEPVIEWVKNELQSKGWKPLNESFLNPGLPSSITKGWESFIDGTINPNQTVHQWIADWSNDSGDIVTYGFRYSYPEKGEKNMSTLFVFGSYSPKKEAQKALELTKKHKNL